MNITDTIKYSSSERTELFRAKTASIFPEKDKLFIENAEECFLGVSLGNKNFSEERIGSMLKWISNRFKKCQLLIGDSIHRITLQSKYDITDKDAIEIAINMGQDFIERTDSILEKYKSLTQFSYVTCNSIQKTEGYNDYLKRLYDYIKINQKFKKSVEEFSIRYHKKNWYGLSEKEKEKQLAMSTQYFLEEFAVFACMAKKGCSIMVYPGTFSSLSEIADGEFPGILKELENLTVVSLNIKRR